MRALHDVTLDVAPGEVHAVIGPNGAGKSTLFGVISGGVRPTAGGVTFQGKDITGHPPERLVRQGMARVFQVPRILPELSVWENIMPAVLAADSIRRPLGPLDLFANRKGLAERSAALLAELELLEQKQQKAAFLAHGDKKRLELAMALALDPVLLLLDEPTAGMSPEETRASVALLAEMKRRRGMTLVMTEHDMSVVFSLADRITVLNRGEVVITGTPDAIRQSERVAEVYLGKEEIHVGG